jgi:hypothetical protein
MIDRGTQERSTPPMKIRSVRLYLECGDKGMSRAMNRAHFGAMYWIETRLKKMHTALHSPDLKGVDLVNIWFCESASLCNPIETWSRLLNAVEYKQIFDVRALIDKDPVENVRGLVVLASGACAAAPWPQVRAIGEILQQPFTAMDCSRLQESLKRWEAFVDEAGAEHGSRQARLH